MHNKSLAIIIPAYKSTFLRETLESIANQTDKNFTLYIGDDCSPHDLKTIVEDYKNRIPIVYHRFETNMGGTNLVGHWDRCISLTRGEKYLWLFSDDDVMDSECVASFHNLDEEIKSNSLIHFNVRMIDDSNGGNITDWPEYPATLNTEDFLKLKLSGKVVSYVVEFIFSRKLYEKVGFQSFDLAWGSDFMTWLKMSSLLPHGIKTIDNKKAKVNWRFSSENISPNKNKETLKRKLNSSIQNAQYVKKLMQENPDKFPTTYLKLRWLYFPVSELYRNKQYLSYIDIAQLLTRFFKKVLLGGKKMWF